MIHHWLWLNHWAPVTEMPHCGCPLVYAGSTFSLRPWVRIEAEKGIWLPQNGVVLLVPLILHQPEKGSLKKNTNPEGTKAKGRRDTGRPKRNRFVSNHMQGFCLSENGPTQARHLLPDRCPASSATPSRKSVWGLCWAHLDLGPRHCFERTLGRWPNPLAEKSECTPCCRGWIFNYYAAAILLGLWAAYLGQELEAQVG